MSTNDSTGQESAGTTQLQTAAEALFGNLTIYHAIGVDTEGRSHHYDPDEEQIVICHTDCYMGSSGISSDDIQERVDIPEWSSTVWDYIRFVREQTDLEWATLAVDDAEDEEDSR